MGQKRKTIHTQNLNKTEEYYVKEIATMDSSTQLSINQWWKWRWFEL